MKKTAVAALIPLILLTQAFTLEGQQQPRGSGQNFELKKAEILNRIDERLARIQQMKSCVQSASSRDDLRACREKFGPKDGQGNRQRRQGGYPGSGATQ